MSQTAEQLQVGEQQGASNGNTAAPATANERGPGETAALALAGTEGATSQQFVDILVRHPAEQRAIIQALHRTKGNAFVQDLVRSPAFTAAAAANPEGLGYFGLSIREKTATWLTDDGSFAGTITQDGVDATYLMNGGNRLDLDAGKDGGTLQWNRNDRLMGELFAKPNTTPAGKDGWLAGGRVPFSTNGGAGNVTLSQTLGAKQSSTLLSADWLSTDKATTLSGAAGLRDGKGYGRFDAKRTYENGNIFANGEVSGTDYRLVAGGEYRTANGSIAANAGVQNGRGIGGFDAKRTLGDTQLFGKGTLGVDDYSLEAGGTHRLSENHLIGSNLSFTGNRPKDGEAGTSNRTLSLFNKQGDATTTFTASRDTGPDLLRNQLGLSYADNSTSIAGTIGTENGKRIAGLDAKHSWNEGHSIYGKGAITPNGYNVDVGGEYARGEGSAFGGSLARTVEGANSTTKLDYYDRTPSREWGVTLSREEEEQLSRWVASGRFKDGNTSIEGSLGRETNAAGNSYMIGSLNASQQFGDGNKITATGNLTETERAAKLAADFKLGEGWTAGGSVGYRDGRDGTPGTTSLSGYQKYVSPNLMHRLNVDVDRGPENKASVSGALDYKLNERVFASAWGNYSVTDGKGGVGAIGAAMTWTPKEKQAFTIAAQAVTGGAGGPGYEVRLQFDQFKRALNTVTDLDEQRAQSMFSVYLSLTYGASPGMLNDRYGAAKHSYNHAFEPKGPAVGVGVRWSF